MVTNLLRPWILSRLLTGAAASALVAYALIIAVRVLRHYRVSATSEGQLALERRAELVATVVQAALVASLFGLALTVLGADRSSDSIRGAMCAYGVFGSTTTGFWALLASALSAAACGLWIVLHRLDLRLETPRLTRRKFASLFAVAPLLFADLALTTAFALELDFTVVASCCSVGLDVGGESLAGALGGPRLLAFALAIAAGVGASLASALLRARPTTGPVVLASGLSVIALGASLPAIVGYVAPHVYESPVHLCPFCLLRPDVGGFGWPLFASVFVGGILGVGLALVRSQAAAAAAPDEVRAMLARMARWNALAWAVTVLLLLAPVIRYRLSTGAALFLGP